MGPIQKAGEFGIVGCSQSQKGRDECHDSSCLNFLNFWAQRIQKGEKAVPAFEKFLSSRGVKGCSQEAHHVYGGEALPSGAKSKGGGACEEEG